MRNGDRDMREPALGVGSEHENGNHESLGFKSANSARAFSIRLSQLLFPLPRGIMNPSFVKT